MMGASAVGKTAIVSQCLTSDYMNTYDASLGKSAMSVNLSSKAIDVSESVCLFVR